MVRNYKYFYRGQYEKNEDSEAVLTGKKRKYNSIDEHLRQFDYKGALLASIESRNTEIVTALIEELMDRNVLPVALKSFSEQELSLVLKWLQWKIRDFKCTKYCCEIINHVVGMYKNAITPSLAVQFKKTVRIVNEEIELKKKFIVIEGVMDSIENTWMFN